MENKSYRPSNGTEGMYFCEKFCRNCINGKYEHTGDTKDNPCEILTLTFFLDIDEKDYPKEWIYDDNGKPTCSAFVKFDWGKDDEGNWIDPEPTQPPEDPNQLCFPFDIIEILGSDYDLVVTSKYITERELV